MSCRSNNVVLNEESEELEYAIISFLVPKRRGVIIRGGAIFGRNTIFGYFPLNLSSYDKRF